MKLSEPQMWLLDWLKERGRDAVAEWKFHKDRKWRFDVAIPTDQLAFEIDGAIWTRGRHARGAGIKKDNEKINTAQALGWRVFRFTPDEVKCGEAAKFIERWML